MYEPKIKELIRRYEQDGMTGPGATTITREKLIGAKFVDLDLLCCEWQNCDLTGATFIDCDVRGSIYTTSNLRAARFIRCSLDACEFPEDAMIDFIDCFDGAQSIKPKSVKQRRLSIVPTGAIGKFGALITGLSSALFLLSFIVEATTL